MDLAKRLLDAFKPYNKPMMYFGLAVIATQVAVKVVQKMRKTDRYAFKASMVNLNTYLGSSKEPWAMIYFNEGDSEELEQLCKQLIFRQINIYVVSTRKNQKLMDKIQSEAVKSLAEVRMRYDLYLFDDPSNETVWNDFRDELDRIDVRIFYVIGDSFKMGWRAFEEMERKRIETELCMAPRYVLPMMMLIFAKTCKPGRKAIIHIDGQLEPEADETNNVLLDGAGAELLFKGIEYKRIVNLQTYLNL